MTDDHPEFLRAFIAVPLPDVLQGRLAELQKQLQAALPELKPASACNLHLTLHFLGELTQEQLAETARVMVSVGEKKKNFNVSLKGLGFFPRRNRPRVLWLGLEPPDQLLTLFAGLADGLRPLGLLGEKHTYRPHLTLGRFKTPPARLDALCPFLSQDFGILRIERLVLYSSRLAATGAIHKPLEEVALKKR